MYTLTGKHLLKESTKRERCETPIFTAHLHVSAADLLDSRRRYQDYTTWLENPVQGSDRGAKVKNKQENLGANDAIKGVGGNLVSIAQVRNNGCVRIIGGEMEHIQLLYFVASKSAGIGIVEKIQHTPAHVVCILFEKLLNVVAVDNLTPTPTPVLIEWGGTSIKAKVVE